MGEKITLENGTEFDGNVIESGDLFIYIDGSNIKTVFDSLIDPENTSEIEYTQVNGKTITYTGYTKLIAVRDEGNDLITAIMRKGV